jgi:hypothetical protein
MFVSQSPPGRFLWHRGQVFKEVVQVFYKLFVAGEQEIYESRIYQKCCSLQQ